MISVIRNDEEKQFYLDQMREITEKIVKQQALPKEARINGWILDKLNKLYDMLEKEVMKYDKLCKF